MPSMAVRAFLSLFVFFFLIVLLPEISARRFHGWEPEIRMPAESEEDEVGTRWAVLVAGSSGYGNYRHQVNLKA